MSKTIITADMVSDKNSPLIGMTLVDGEDKVTVRIPPEGIPMSVKSLRVPMDLYEKAEALQHPAGFSGVVRDALAAYLTPEHQADDARHALSVLQQVVTRLEAA